MQAELLKLAQLSLHKYEFHTLLGMSYNDGRITAWYNDQMIHSAPLSLSLVHNAIIQSIFGNDHSIQVINHPLDLQTEEQEEIDRAFRWESFFSDVFPYIFPFIIYIIMSILSAKYSTFYIEV